MTGTVTNKKVFIALKMAGVAGQDKLAGIFRYLREEYGTPSPWDIKLVRTQAELTKELVDRSLEDGFDGFIISIPESERAVEAISGVSTPAIVMDVRAGALDERGKNIVKIRNSAEKIGRVAADYLMGLGVARSYAFLHPDPPTDWSVKRFDAFRRTLAENGLWCEELRTPEKIIRLKRPVAAFAACDDRAHDLLKFLSSRHIHVPRDIAVLGVDNDSLICENTHPRLSSVMPDFEGEGYLAAKTLDAMMRGKEPAEMLLFADVKDVVRRESTSELSPAGRMVQKALVYIERHALEGIGVKDVVRHLKCSRSLADLRFRQLQDRSILQAITEKRLEEVRHRLRETRATIDSIAYGCGYANSNYLKNLFKKRFGMSMRTFRKMSG